MTSEFIVSVSETDFEYQVIAYSRQVPVIVDFWAEWCNPCKMLGPILERLATEAQGAFRLAKVNVDENPNLALQYGIRSIPHVKAFRDEQPVSEFIGLLPEPRVREFIRALAPSQTDLILEKGLSQLALQNWPAAEKSLRQFLEKSPDFPPALLGLMKSVLMQGQLDEAEQICNKFPPSKEYAAAEIMLPLLEALKRVQTKAAFSDDPLEAAYQNSLRLIIRGNLPAAMDGMLDILRQDKHYHGDEVRLVLLGLFEVLGEENPITQQYRRELSMILF
jgi:putative thioredoxin